MTIKAIIQSKGDAVTTIGPNATVSEAIALLSDMRIGALPVVEHGSVRGIFSERDVIYSTAKHGAAALNTKVGDVMTAPALTVSPDTQVLSALSLMTKRRIRHLPVVENGNLIGFVSIGDLVKYRIDSIEAEAMAMRDYIQTA
jgi:CBS domain-containing protein